MPQRGIRATLGMRTSAVQSTAGMAGWRRARGGIAVRGVSTPLNGSTGTSFTLPISGALVAGDLLLGIISGVSSSGVTLPLVGPSGWTPLLVQDGVTIIEHIGVYYRIATAADCAPNSPSYAVTSGTSFTRWTTNTIAYSGVDRAVPFDTVAPVLTILAQTTGQGTSFAYAVPGLTSCSANAWLVGYFAQPTSSLLSVQALPSAFTRRWENDATVTNGGPNSVASFGDAQKPVPGATGALQWTSSGDRDTLILTAALRPSS